MSDAPLPLPPSVRKDTIFHQMAKMSWISVVISFVINLATVPVSGAAPISRLWVAAMVGFFLLVGTICGIGALFGIPKYGRKGILLPAVMGLVTWGLMFVIAIPSLMLARRRALEASARKPAVLAAAVHSPHAERFKDERIGFEFDVPEGFLPAAKEKIPSGAVQLYYKSTGPKTAAIVIVKPLGDRLSPQRLTPANFPPGSPATLAILNWRGLEIDGTRILEKTPAGDYITLNVNVPLRKEAVQFGFGSPADTEAEMRAVAERLLKSLEGESNW